MTIERSNPAVPGATSEGQAADPVDRNVVSPGMRLQILSTEHWSLLASRSLAWNESFTRAGMFLSTLSGAMVALALVAQASAFGNAFVLFALVILPVVLFVGLGTFLRLGVANWHDATCIVGMNRIRGAYLELAPELEKYFVMSAHDDVRGVGVTMGMGPPGGALGHLLGATPMLVSVLNSVLVGVIAALLASQFRVPVTEYVVGIIGWVGSMVLHGLYIGQNVRRGQASIQPLFPSPAD